MTGPLTGVRVLDVAQGVAAPFAAQLLRWLGARVATVDPRDSWLQQLGCAPDSLGRCLLDYVNGGKTVEPVPAEPGPWLAHRLPDVDVLVCDATAAGWRTLGLDPAELVRAHPHLVLLSVTGYGLTGPGADRPASELTVYHDGGEGYLLPGGDVYRAHPDRPPVRGGRFLADLDAGLAGAAGVLAALVRRGVSGRGDLVEVSAQEVELGNNRTTLGRAFHEDVDFDRGYAGYDYAGVLLCRDGWICLRPSEERHWTQFCAVIGRPELVTDPRFATRGARFEHNDALNAVLGEWTLTRSQSEVRAALLRAGCPGGPYLDAAGVLADPAIGSRGLIGEHPSGGLAPQGLMHVASTSTGEGAGGHGLRGRMSVATGAGPLAGLRVLDLTWVAAGPYATELLAFLGAEVFKVESRTVPDLFRRGLADPLADLDANIRFADLNQGKQSVAVNLKLDRGRALLLDLAARCDVVIDNYRPGVRERLGLGDAALHARNPDLVVVSLSGFGATATDADRPGYASIFSAESGLSSMTGYPDASPADIRDSNDLRTGTAGALGVLAGLLEVATGHREVSVDASARDTLVALQGDTLLQASRGAPPTRSGNTLEECAPYDCYPARDGWVAVAVRTEAEWCGLVEATGDPELAEPALRRRDVRLTSRARVDARLAAWCGERGADEAADTLSRHGVPSARSRPASSLRADEHLAARGFLRPATHPVLGELLLLGCPLRFHGAGTVEGRRPPLLGEHTASVLGAVLGLDGAAIADLRSAGVLT